MGIRSLSGATLSSAIAYIDSEPVPVDSVELVIYHLGTNNSKVNSTDEIEQKLNTLATKSATKFPKAKIGFRGIPQNH